MPESGSNGPRSIAYLPWMDGMRGLAVLAVMAFHENVTQHSLALGRFIGGGYLGVDVFFAISGFLITSLLLREVAARGRIRFGAFYVRRMRRLMPALALLLAVLAANAFLFETGRARTRSLQHVLVAGTYTANWYIVLAGKLLHELNHTWSLAAEEQFYLAWPAVLTVVVLITRRRSAAIVGVVAALAAIAVLWPFAAAARGWTPARIYYGLDTRASALAIGCLLGAAWSLGLLPTRRAAAVARRASAVVGVVALVAVLHDPSVIHSRTAQFGVVGLATGGVIWELLGSAPHLGHRLLSWAPLVAVGRISYGLYLWDAVVVIKFDPRGFRGAQLVLVHLALTFALATASWFVVERRFRVRRLATGDGDATRQSEDGAG